MRYALLSALFLFVTFANANAEPSKSFDCQAWRAGKIGKPSNLPSQDALVAVKALGINGQSITLYLTRAAAEAVQKIIKAAPKLKHDFKREIRFSSSWRSFEAQARLYCSTENPQGIVAIPGFSNHQYGTAVDVAFVDDQGKRLTFQGRNAQNDSSEVKLLEAIMREAGFIATLESEHAWHYEFKPEAVPPSGT